MKLRNKKTGEIMDDVQYRNYSLSDGFGFRMNGKEWEYHSLAEFNEDWEDYEENELYFCITGFNDGVTYMRNHNKPLNQFDISIGNYFKTREEAEKAVEKLKAWKRLKDKGFRFTGINDEEDSQSMIYQCGILCEANIEYRLSKDEDFILLFGDEDELRKQER